MKMPTDEFYKWIRIARKLQAKERYIKAIDSRIHTYTNSDAEKIIDKLKINAMTQDELEQEIERSAQNFGDFGKA
jgi:ribosome-binding protein aMBF1 (putative translation factor)